MYFYNDKNYPDFVVEMHFTAKLFILRQSAVFITFDNVNKYLIDRGELRALKESWRWIRPLLIV